MVEDAKTAVRFLRANAEKLGIDPNHIAVMGESAGGYLAAMVGTTSGHKEFDQGEYSNQSSDVQAVVDLYGLSDLTKVGADFSADIQKRISHRPFLRRCWLMVFPGKVVALSPPIPKRPNGLIPLHGFRIKRRLFC